MLDWCRIRRSKFGLPALVFLLAGCQPDPNWANKKALQVGYPGPEEISLRQKHVFQFPEAAEPAVLLEATQVLQDLGFNVEESAPRYGVLAGSKERDATETGQVAAQVAATIALAVVGVRYNPVWDTDQVVRVTVTTRPFGKRDTTMRVSFERIVTDTNRASRVELLTQPEFADGFANKLREGLSRGAAR